MQVRTAGVFRCRPGSARGTPAPLPPVSFTDAASSPVRKPPTGTNPSADCLHGLVFPFSRAGDETVRRHSLLQTNQADKTGRVYNGKDTHVSWFRPFSTRGHLHGASQKSAARSAPNDRRKSASRINVAVDRLTSNIHDISDMSPHVLTTAATAAAKRGMKGHWAACVSRAFELRRGLSVRDAALLFTATARMHAQDARFLDMLADVLLTKFRKVQEQQALQEQLQEQQQRQRRRDSLRAESPLPASRSRPQSHTLSPDSPGLPDSGSHVCPSPASPGSFTECSSQLRSASAPSSPSPVAATSSRLPPAASPPSLPVIHPAVSLPSESRAAAFSPFAIYSVAVACASLRYFNEELLTALATGATHVPLSAFNGFDLVGLLAAFASLNFVPPPAFLRQAHRLLGNEMRLWTSRVQQALHGHQKSLEGRAHAADRPGQTSVVGKPSHVPPPPQFGESFPRGWPDGGADENWQTRRSADCTSSSCSPLSGGKCRDEERMSEHTTGFREEHRVPREPHFGRELPIMDAVTHGSLPDRQTVNVASVLHSMAKIAERSEALSAQGQREAGRDFGLPARHDTTGVRQLRDGGGKEQTEFFKICLTLIRTHLSAHLNSGRISENDLVFSGCAASDGTPFAADQAQQPEREPHRNVGASRHVAVDPSSSFLCPRYNFAFSLTSLRDISAIACALNFLPSLHFFSALKESQGSSTATSSVVRVILDDLALLAPRIAERSETTSAAPADLGPPAWAPSVTGDSLSSVSSYPPRSFDSRGEAPATQGSGRLSCPRGSVLLPGAGQAVPGAVSPGVASCADLRRSSSPSTFLSLLAIARAHSRLQPPVHPQVHLLSCCLREMQRHPSLLTAMRFVALWRIFSSLCPRNVEEVFRSRGCPRGIAAGREAPQLRLQMEHSFSGEATVAATPKEPSSPLWVGSDQDVERVAALGRAAFGFLCQHSERLIFACTLPQLASVASSLLAFEPLFKTADAEEVRSAYAVQATSVANAIRRRLVQLYRMQEERPLGAIGQGDFDQRDGFEGGASEVYRSEMEPTARMSKCNASAEELPYPECIETARQNGARGKLLERPQQVVWLMGVLGRFTPESGQYAALPLLTALCASGGVESTQKYLSSESRIFARPDSSLKGYPPISSGRIVPGHDGGPNRANATENLSHAFASTWVQGLSAQEAAVLLRAMARLHLRHIPLLTQICVHISVLLDTSLNGSDQNVDQQKRGTPIGDSTVVVCDADIERKSTQGGLNPISEWSSEAHDGRAQGFTSASSYGSMTPSSSGPLCVSGHASSSSLASILLALAKLAFHPFFLSGPNACALRSSALPVSRINGMPPSEAQPDASRSGIFGVRTLQPVTQGCTPDSAAASAWTAVLRSLTLRCERMSLDFSASKSPPTESEGQTFPELGSQRCALMRSNTDSVGHVTEEPVTLFTAVNALYALALVDFDSCCVKTVQNGNQTPPTWESFGEHGAAQSTSAELCEGSNRGRAERAGEHLFSEAIAALVTVCKGHLFTNGTRNLSTTPSAVQTEGECGSNSEEAEFEGRLSENAVKDVAFEVDTFDAGGGERGTSEIFGQLIAVHASLERLQASHTATCHSRGAAATQEGNAGCPPSSAKAVCEPQHQGPVSPQTMETLKLARNRGENVLRTGRMPSPATLATSAFHRQAMMALEATLPEERFLTEVPFLSGVFFIDCVLHERSPPVAIEFDGPLHFYHPACYSCSTPRHSEVDGSEAEGSEQVVFYDFEDFDQVSKISSHSVEGGTGRSVREDRMHHFGADTKRQACDPSDKEKRMTSQHRRWRGLRAAQYTSLSLFKQRLLERHGFRVVRIAYSDWMRLDGDLEKQRHFLLRKIGTAPD
ncbi:RAP domain-containing protein [Toxoplasma gondii VEG]|uniref:RAP domain-containing protein n=3 Tax=Toxoplasma gondii TaxID=5811 RepID=V4ZGL5_TOXGV|nr:RAP domain-containing protein [Toxoplasma gondii VEG]KFG45636.1 RAP domain-containing protein [Toxoplasma gondii p89]PUA89527.1 RAP domain-containing protein [Toxoplasma gondii TgCATBr9]CEL73915.1 TPA: RAP domain-containing protein [Toxoplasma gondii VEG]